MPLPRFQRLDPERRRIILDAAAREFAEHGFRGASYNGIIAQAGVSKGAMYYYFDDKVDLFLAVVSDAFGDLASSFGRFPEVDSPEPFWAALGDLFMDLWNAIAGDERALGIGRALATAIDTGEIPPEALTFMKEMEQVTTGIVQTGQRVGAIRTDLPTDFLVRLFVVTGQACDAWVAANLDTLTPEQLTEFIPKSLDIFRRIGEPRHG